MLSELVNLRFFGGTIGIQQDFSIFCLKGRFSTNPALGRFDKVAKIIHADAWSWPRLPTENMRNLADNMPNSVPSSAIKDKVVCCVEKEKEFSVQKVWNFFRSGG